MTEIDPESDHVPTMRFTVQCIRDDQIDGVYDDLTGPEAAERIATMLDEAIERKTGQPPWSDEDWKPWRAGLQRALSEAENTPDA